MERIRLTMRFLARYTHYLGDQEYMKDASVCHLTEFFPWIESQGIYLLRDQYGEIVTDHPKRSQAWAVQMGMSGTVIMDVLRKAILASPIRLLEQTTATRQLTRQGLGGGPGGPELRARGTVRDRAIYVSRL